MINFVPRDYQRRAIYELESMRYAAVFAALGAGKTTIMLSLLNRLEAVESALPALIIAPLQVCRLVWPEEIKKFQQFAWMRYIVLHGKNKEQKAELPADIYIVNVENFFWLLESEFQAPTLIIDELSCFKGPTTKRTKFLYKYGNIFRRRYGLTATPQPNSLMDLFGQILVTAGDSPFGRYITHYRTKYFIPILRDNYVIYRPKETAANDVYTKIAPVTVRIKAEELKMIPLLFNTIRIQLQKEAKECYKNAEKSLFKMLDGDESVIKSQYGACCQIANGVLYNPQEPVKKHVDAYQRGWQVIHREKIEALLRQISELQGAPLLVAYWYRHELLEILKSLPYGTPYIGLGVREKEIKRIVQNWNRGQIRVLLGHPASMGYGLNLQYGPGRDICFFNVPDSPEKYWQFIGRIHRPGMKEQVRVHHIVATKTVDELKYRRLQQKDAAQRSLFEWLKEYKNETTYFE